MPFRPPDPTQMGRYVALAQVGLEMVMPIVIGLVLDYYLGISPWAVVLGTVIGFVGGLLHLLALLKRFEEDRTRQPPENRGT